jgi:dienelactone hydrolase
MRDDLATVCYYGFPAGPAGPPGEPTRTAPKPLDVVDTMTGPILGFWGDRDERVGMANVAALAEALTTRDVDFRHTVFQGLDHGFMAASFELGAEGYDAARSSWTRTLEFFKAQT